MRVKRPEVTPLVALEALPELADVWPIDSRTFRRQPDDNDHRTD